MFLNLDVSIVADVKERPKYWNWRRTNEYNWKQNNLNPFKCTENADGSWVQDQMV